MKLFRERAMQLGNEFNIREFMDAQTNKRSSHPE